jgi:tetratricopeptide (TPR) repeat protein
MTRAHLALPFAVVLASVALLDARQPPAPSVITLITQYAQGQPDDAVRLAAGIRDLGPLRLRFVQDVPAWIASDPARATERRAAAAAFLLELAAARLVTDWGRLSDLVEFTCAGLRAAGPPSPFELAWDRASMALAGLARARLWLLGEYARLPHQPARRTTPSKRADQYPRHLVHALERFPDDPPLRLARIVAWTWGRDHEPTRNVRPRESRYAADAPLPQREAIVALRPLIDDPVVGPEALVRIAHVYMTMEELPEALAELKQAQARQADRSIRYLSFFSAGRVLEALRRPDEAMAEYTKALEVIPGAESATVALGTLQFVHADREAAVSRLNTVFDRPGAAVDPGRLVGYGSYIHWNALRQAMRAELPR